MVHQDKEEEKHLSPWWYYGVITEPWNSLKREIGTGFKQLPEMMVPYQPCKNENHCLC